MVSRNGSCVCLGAKTVSDIQKSANWVSNLLDTPITQPITISNIVYAYKRHPMKLEQIKKILDARFHAKKIPMACSFEPELSPALIYYPLTDSNAVALLFRTGKVNITGLKDESFIQNVVSEIESQIHT